MSTTILRDCSKNIPHFVADSSVSPQGLKWAVDPVADVITTAGDLIYGTAADTVARLGIGTAGQVLKVNSGATAPEWAAPAGGGKVLQVVSATTTTETAINTATFTDTTITATITPTLATSKILILVSASVLIQESSSTEIANQARLMRGASAIQTWSGNGFMKIGGASGTLRLIGVYAMTYLDSPATTSATTYKVQSLAMAGLTGTIWQRDSQQPSTITLLEIGV